MKKEYTAPEIKCFLLLSEASICQLSGDVDDVPEEDWGTL